MATERQIAANRANAKRSTGPKTNEGREASSRNALRHGLASAANPLQRIAIEIDSLAEALVQEGTDQTQIVNARQLARAHVEVLRVRTVRAALLASFDLGDCNKDDLSRLLALGRYDSLARGKRRRAARAFFAK
jgi:hypothetical protein